MFAEERVAHRLGVSIRVIRTRSRAKGVGRKFGRTWHFTEAEIIALGDKGKNACSDLQSGTDHQTGRRAGHISGSALSEALKLAIGDKPENCSPKSKAKFSSSKRVVPFVPRPRSRQPR
jgi:hypothetical protein